MPSLARTYVALAVNRTNRSIAFDDDFDDFDDDDDVKSTSKRTNGGAYATCASDGVAFRRLGDDVVVASTNRRRGDSTMTNERSSARAHATAIASIGDGVFCYGDASGGAACASSDGARVAWRAHEYGPVRDVRGVRVSEDVSVVVTCADDGRVEAWRVSAGGRASASAGGVSLAQTSAPLCLDITRVSSASAGEERYLLAVGCVDGRTRVYACDFTALAGEGETRARFESCGALDGHDDWVRAVAFAPTRASDGLFLATASQDRSVRVWRIEVVSQSGKETAETAAFTRLAAPPNPPSALLGGRRVKTSLESLLIGHEDWVMSAAWHPDPAKMVLMTASMDRSLMLWSPTGVPSASEDAGTELWMSTASLGEAAAVCLGYYGAAFSPKGDLILANSHGGALHAWRQTANGEWTPEPGSSGHTMEVTCLQWDTAGRWLLSGSQDQTTRVHAPWHRDGSHEWHQVARPQVHGHDIVCLATMREMDEDAGTITYVSGADEKILRVFEAPGTFLGTMANSLGDHDPAGVAALTTAKALSMEALGAELPALGLSNKALHGGDQEVLPSDVAGLREQAEQQEGLMEEYNARGVEAITPQALTTPPLEEVLAQATLWPETRKLYGHGNEVRAVAAHCGGDLIASASSALTPAAASVWIWSRSQSWKPLGRLTGPTLTVVALEFTPESAARDGLLAASRDRHVCLYAPISPSAPRGVFAPDTWRLVTRFKAHDREIFAASWAPCGTLFATAGRDKKVKLWRVVGDECALEYELPKFDDAPTATAFAPASLGLTLAIGFEDGIVDVFSFEPASASWERCAQTRHEERHGAAVRDVKWQPRPPHALATCSDDRAVHIYDFDPHSNPLQ